MSISLNAPAYDHAKKLIEDGRYKYVDVELALAHLHGMLEGIRAAQGAGA